MIREKLASLITKYFIDKQVAEIEKSIKKNLFIEEAKNYISTINNKNNINDKRKDRIVVSLTSF